MVLAQHGLRIFQLDKKRQGLSWYVHGIRTSETKEALEMTRQSARLDLPMDFG